MYYSENTPSPYQERPETPEPDRKPPRFRAALAAFALGVTGLLVAERATGDIDPISAIGSTQQVEAYPEVGVIPLDVSPSEQSSEAATADKPAETDTKSTAPTPQEKVVEQQPEKVAKPAPEPKTIMAVGDICKPAYGCMPLGGLVKRQRASKEGLDKFLVLGDSQYDTGLYSMFRKYYHPALGAQRDITMAAIGNHEMKSGGDGYYKYFFGGKYTPYHAQQIGSWLVVAVNSEIAAGPGSKQAEWLKDTLEKSDAKCKLVFQHKPRWSVGSHGSDPNMATLFQIMHKGGVDVNLAGHDHNYQRYKPVDGNGNLQRDGIRTWVVGTGGAENYPLGSSKAIDTKFNGAIGALKMTLSDGWYKASFVGTRGTRDSINETCDNDR